MTAPGPLWRTALVAMLLVLGGVGCPAPRPGGPPLAVPPSAPPLLGTPPDLVTDHHGAITALAVAPDGSLLATGGDDRQVSIWRRPDGGRLATLLGHAGAIGQLRFGPWGRLLASSSPESVRLWDVQSGRLRWTVPLPAGGGYAFAFRPDGGELAVARGGEVVLLGTETGSERCRLAVGAGPIRSLAFHPTGATMLIADASGLVRTWAVESCAPAGEALPMRAAGTQALALAPDGRRLAVATTDGIRLWDVASGRPEQLIALAPGSLLAQLRFVDAGTLAGIVLTPAAAGARAEAVVWGLTSAEQPRLRLPHALALTSEPSGAAAEPVVAAAIGRRVRFRVVPGPPARTAAFVPAYGHGGRVTSLHAAGEPASMLVASAGGAVHRLDPGAAEPVRRIGRYDTADPVRAVAASRSGLVALARGRALELLSPDDHPLAALPLPGAEPPTSAAFSGDEQRLLVAWPHALTVWQVATGAIATHLDGARLGLEPGDGVTSATLDPRGDLLAWGSGRGRLVVWSVAQQRALLDRRGDDGEVRAVAIDASGTLVASAFDHGPVELWRLGDDEPGQLDAFASALAFSPQGTLLATASPEGTVVLWDAVSGAAQAEVSLGVPASALAFSASGRRLWIGSDDGRLAVLDVARGEMVAEVVVTDAPGLLAVAVRDGSFWATPGVLATERLHRGGQILSLEQLETTHHRPAALLPLLGLDDALHARALAAAADRTRRRLGLPDAPPPPPAGTLPTVELEAGLPPTTSLAALRVAIRAAAPGGRLLRLRASVGGVPALGAAGLPIDAPSWQGHVELPLAPGRNTIRLSVLDAGGRSSAPLDTVVHRESPTPTERDLYVLAIGVSRHDAVAFDLRFPASDATALANLLADTSGPYRQVHRRVLTNAETTRDGLREHGRALLAGARADDDVLIFFAGHLLRDEGLRTYLATYDVDFTRPAARGLPLDELETLLDGTAARHRLVLLDGFFVGQLERAAPPIGALRPPGASLPGLTRLPEATHVASLQMELAGLGRACGATVIATSTGHELAASPDGDHGLLTHSVIEALRTQAADDDGDAQITAAELGAHVARRLAERTGRRQVPLIGDAAMASGVVLASARMPTTTLTLPPDAWAAPVLAGDGRALAVALPTGELRLYDLPAPSPRPLPPLADKPTERLRGLPGPHGVLLVGPDGRYLVQAVAGRAPLLFDRASGSSSPLGDPHPALPRVRLDATGRLVAISGAVDTRVYATSTAAMQHRWDEQGELVAVDPTELTLLDGVHGFRHLELSTKIIKRVTPTPDAMKSALTGAQLSADGRLLAVSNGPVLLVWDVPGRRVLRTLPVDGVLGGIAFTPDGRYLAVGTPRVRVFRTETGEEVAWLRHDEPAGGPFAVALSDDGRRVVARRGERILVWDR